MKRIKMCLLAFLCALLDCSVVDVPCAPGDVSCNPAAVLLYALKADESSAPPRDELYLAQSYSCILMVDGSVRCWGNSPQGQLGYGNTNTIGDDELPASAGDVSVGETPISLATGQHTCALFGTGKMRCWGSSNFGQLGYGNTNHIGDDELPSTVGEVDVGGTVTAIAAGGLHTCALLDTGNVRCWGHGANGKLGYGNTNDIGDNETPASAGDVNVGGTVTAITAGSNHTCALLTTGNVRCWGQATSGQLGYGNTNSIGDDETPASAGDVNLGGTVIAIDTRTDHTCALLASGNIRCWGSGGFGQLGYANTNTIGDDETPASAGDVNVGGTVSAFAVGGFHTCALLHAGSLRCWGFGIVGSLGYGNTNNIGDDETPASAGDVNVGGSVVAIDAGTAHACALLTTDKVRCWGQGTSGKLGYGNTNDIGDDELPASAGDVIYKLDTE